MHLSERLRAGPVTMGLLLAATAAATLALWWPFGSELHVPSDDWVMMVVSRHVAAGRWALLMSPQEVHVLPLFRLVRLYFDLHFPEQFVWMHRLALAAHLLSGLLLFALCRRYFRTPWAALGATGLFLWHALSAEAILIKSQNTYVFSLPLLLGGVYCAVQFRTRGGRIWVAGWLVSLAAAVAMHSMPAVWATLGALVAYYMPGSPAPSGTRRQHWPAWIATAIPAALGVAVWAIWCLPTVGTAHRPGFVGVPQGAGHAVSRGWNVLMGLALHFGVLVRRADHGQLGLAAAALALAFVILLLRKQRSCGLILALLAMTAVPLGVMFAIRGWQAYHLSRYFYQSFLVVAAAAGGVVDVALTGLERRSRLRTAALLLLAGVAGVYFFTQRRFLQYRSDILRAEFRMPREFWLGWARFFDQTAARARAASRSFRLPVFDVAAAMRSDELFGHCRPGGLPGMVVLSPEETHAEDCVRLWQELAEARRRGVFDGVALRSSMAIVKGNDAPPAADVLICRVAESP